MSNTTTMAKIHRGVLEEIVTAQMRDGRSYFKYLFESLREDELFVASAFHQYPTVKVCCYLKNQILSGVFKAVGHIFLFFKFLALLGFTVKRSFNLKY